VRTYVRVGTLEHHVQPVKALTDVGLPGRSYSDSDREQNDCGKSRQECRRHAHEEIVKEVCLLVRLEPL
jgi:hypothetical protein